MEIFLQEILAAREKRAQTQKKLLDRYHMNLVCFTMNIAGPVKNSPLITAGFRLGQALLSDRFVPEYAEETVDNTGCTGYWVIDGDPLVIKQQTAQIEDSLPMGRLFDMDVLSCDGQKISRQQLGLAGRKCLLCDNDAMVCGRSRAHSVEQLQAETHRLLTEGLQARKAAKIGGKATYSLICEVYTTPKPGLVDNRNNGSHKDMDKKMFLFSAQALEPYFVKCVQLGQQTAHLPAADTFALLRNAGLEGEQLMYRETCGVNTHKGAIFTLGLLCGAAGRLDTSEPELLLSEVKAMTAGLCSRDFAGITEENAVTTGQKLYAKYGITGVRGQAEEGFPALLNVGLPVLKQGLSSGYDLNDAGCAVLLHLLKTVTDTNMIARSDVVTAKAMAEKIGGILAVTPYPNAETLEQLDAEFMEKNLSPGGSADLLAATYFLHFLKEE